MGYIGSEPGQKDIAAYTNIGAAPAETDELLISDAGVLKAITVDKLLDPAGYTNIGAQPAGSDEVLLSDAGVLKAVTVDNLIAGAGGGKVLQIVHTSNATEATTNSTSYGNTAHTVTITPAGAGSVILVGVSFSAGVERDAITEASGYYKLCNTTDSADLVEAVYQVNGAEGDLGMFSFQTLIGVDTGRAGATEYYLQYKSANASATTYVNNSNDPGQMWAIEFSS